MDILAIVIMVIIAGVVAIAWRIRAAMDESNKGLKEQPVLSKKIEKSQIQISIERLEQQQVENSKTLNQIFEIISKENNQKAKKMKSQKTNTKKTISRQKKKEV